jgi:hypothetical protein
MENQIKNNTKQETIQKSTLTPLEVKPKLESWTIYIPTIFGIILAAVIAYLGKIIWDKRQRFIKASDDFRAAFDIAVHALETIPFCDRDIINENFRTHEKAMIKFRDNIKRKRKLNSFNKDWQQYEQYCLSRVDVPLLCFIATEVSDINGPSDSAEIDLKHRQKALEHIRKLLSYTKK